MLIHQSYGFLAIAMLLVVTVRIQSKPLTTTLQAQTYLSQFGYLSDYSIANKSFVDANIFRKAVQDFQSFAGLNKTGVLDENTLDVMSLARCAVRDKVSFGNHNREKRYNFQGSHWVIKNLTYQILSYPKGFEESYVDEEIARAFDIWSEFTDLSFTHKTVGPVHIKVKFVVGDHGDINPFDGPDGVFAHAFSPAYGGEIHFDGDELWAVGAPPGVSLFQVAAHEFGHSLGLHHSNIFSSVMNPFYYGYDSDFKLDSDDILAIQTLYGKRFSRSGLPSDFGPPHISSDDKLCRDPKIDTIFNSTDGQIYAFKGKRYYRISKTALAHGYPKLISDGWPGLPGNIDAAFAYKNGKTYFFKGTEYWRYHGRRMDNNFPRKIHKDFLDLPNNLDAAMVWNDIIYFYKGSQFWRFQILKKPKAKYGYPKSISNWSGLPRNVDAAIQLTDDLAFFFKGNKYYEFDPATFRVNIALPPFPRPLVHWWFICESVSLATNNRIY